jgi:hypothetical protein
MSNLIESNCIYTKTCPDKTQNCEEMIMTEIHAKPIVDGKFWIIEQNGSKIATLHKKENNKYMLSSTNGEVMFNKKQDLTKEFGDGFFLSGDKVKVTTANNTNECHGYSTSVRPFNDMYDVRRKLPLFTKSKSSKSLYCAGYYIIKFNKGWVKSWCPKLITLERNPYKGPFRTEIEMKQVLSNAKSD